MHKLKCIIAVVMVMLSMYPLFWYITDELNPLKWPAIIKVIVVVFETYIVKTGLSVYRDDKE